MPYFSGFTILLLEGEITIDSLILFLSICWVNSTTSAWGNSKLPSKSC